MLNDAQSDHQDVEFYRSLKMVLHTQDINDLEQHYERRDSLYRQLGIPAAAVRGANVIEFGPGSGYNALYTVSLRPANVTLVDAVPQCIADMRELFARYEVRAGIRIVESLIEEFDVEPAYDLVLAEGVICHQRDPGALARRISDFARPNGIVVLTCSDAASIMGEIGRRFIGARLASTGLTVDERLAVLRPTIGPHLATLRGMSRSVDAWIIDNVIRPIGDAKLLTIRDAIEAVAGTCDMYGGSPHFVTDWRWYKQITGAERDFNARAIQIYEESTLNFLDYRFEHGRQPVELGRAVLAECDACYELVSQAEAGIDVMPAVLNHLERLGGLVKSVSPQTAASFESLRRFLASPAPSDGMLNDFAPYFGRGMQYLSFIRRPVDR